MIARAFRTISGITLILLLTASAVHAYELSFTVDELTANRWAVAWYDEDSIFGNKPPLASPSVPPPPPILRFGGSGGGGIEVNGISYGHAPGTISTAKAWFSVGMATGAAGTAVNNEPAAERMSDIYQGFNNSNYQRYDGDGLPWSATVHPLSVPEPFSTNVDGIDLRSGMDTIFWTIDASTAGSSVVYTNPGYSSADIFVDDALATYAGAPALYADSGELSLTATDDIDALVVLDNGDDDYNSVDDTVYFSLANLSPTLTSIGASKGDILITGGGDPSVRVFATAASLGLLSTDELNALDYAPEPAALTLLALGGLALMRRGRCNRVPRRRN